MVTYRPQNQTGSAGYDKKPTGIQEPVAALRLRNTAGLSRELSKGDVVAVGEAGLAVGRVGWTPVCGALNEVCTSDHGTCPLPPVSPSEEPGT